jgi:hypothetical protein
MGAGRRGLADRCEEALPALAAHASPSVQLPVAAGDREDTRHRSRAPGCSSRTELGSRAEIRSALATHTDGSRRQRQAVSGAGCRGRECGRCAETRRSPPHSTRNDIRRRRQTPRRGAFWCVSFDTPSASGGGIRRRECLQWPACSSNGTGRPLADAWRVLPSSGGTRHSMIARNRFASRSLGIARSFGARPLPASSSDRTSRHTLGSRRETAFAGALRSACTGRPLPTLPHGRRDMLRDFRSLDLAA